MGRLVRDDRKTTVTQITTRYNQGMQNTISEHTTRRTLKQMGSSSRRPHRVPLLSDKNRTRRIQFTQDHQNWTIEDRKNVAWSDESRFLLQHSEDRVRIWHKEHESIDPSCLVSTVQAGGGGVMVWGIFSWHALVPLVPIEHSLNATADLSIVADHVHPFMTTVYPSSDDYQIISDWFLEHDNEFTLLKWPPQSPDLVILNPQPEMLLSRWPSLYFLAIFLSTESKNLACFSQISTENQNHLLFCVKEVISCRFSKQNSLQPLAWQVTLASQTPERYWRPCRYCCSV